MNAVFENMRVTLLFMATGKRITFEAPLPQLPTLRHKPKVRACIRHHLT